MGSGEVIARVILVVNVFIYIAVELAIVIKASKLPNPAGYPPADWDWFQRWVENKYFWVELVAFLLISCVLGYVLCM